MTPVLLHRPAPKDPALFPDAPEPFEEVGAAAPADVAAALAFAVSRLVAAQAPGPAGRPLVLVTTPPWLQERGRPFARGLMAWGLDPGRLIWVRCQREAEALWVLEEALKSGAVDGGLATLEQPSFVATRRLDFAARAGGAVGVLLRAKPATDLSAARMRWRIGARPSAGHPYDAHAPGAVRLTAVLARRRDGPPGAWDLEQDDETGRLRVAAGLADHGVVEAGPVAARAAA